MRVVKTLLSTLPCCGSSGIGNSKRPASYKSRAMTHRLDPTKALEALLYVAPRVDGDLYTTLKALYIADKLHLERYGRQIYGDSYRAMDHGPTGSTAYDTMQDIRDRRRFRQGVAEADKAMRVSGDNKVTVLREASTYELSKSDIRALDAAIDKVSGRSFGEVRAEVHDSAWRSSKRNQWMSLESIAGTLKNGSDLVEYLRERIPAEK